MHVASWGVGPLPCRHPNAPDIQTSPWLVQRLLTTHLLVGLAAASRCPLVVRHGCCYFIFILLTGCWRLSYAHEQMVRQACSWLSPKHNNKRTVKVKTTTPGCRSLKICLAKPGQGLWEGLLPREVFSGSLIFTKQPVWHGATRCCRRCRLGMPVWPSTQLRARGEAGGAERQGSARQTAGAGIYWHRGQCTAVAEPPSTSAAQAQQQMVATSVVAVLVTGNLAGALIKGEQAAAASPEHQPCVWRRQSEAARKP